MGLYEMGTIKLIRWQEALTKGRRQQKQPLWFGLLTGELHVGDCGSVALGAVGGEVQDLVRGHPVHVVISCGLE